MSTKAEMGDQKPPFWGSYIGRPIVVNNHKFGENGASCGKNVGAELSEYTHGSASRVPRSAQVCNISRKRQRTEVYAKMSVMTPLFDLYMPRNLFSDQNPPFSGAPYGKVPLQGITVNNRKTAQDRLKVSRDH